MHAQLQLQAAHAWRMHSIFASARSIIVMATMPRPKFAAVLPSPLAAGQLGVTILACCAPPAGSDPLARRLFLGLQNVV